MARRREAVAWFRPVFGEAVIPPLYPACSVLRSEPWVESSELL
jgi:hypothetical protein